MGAFSLVSVSGQLAIVVCLHAREALEQGVTEVESSGTSITLNATE
jgi:hypothetical protein